MKSPHRLVLPFALVLVVSGCGSREEQGGAGWQPLAEIEMTADQIAQRDRAHAARDDIAMSLKTRLMDAIGAEGPAAAIDICAGEAPEIAAHVSAAHGVSIGRTSFRLRNPENTPPVWAAPLIAERVVEPTYLTKDGALAALLPIRLQPECLVCHGRSEELAPDVAEVLAERYPEDEATGFAPGELRGWFWVDVPASDGP